MPETKIGLLRHGQTDWNIEFRLQGVTDIPLNETGVGQARDAAAAIKSTDWDVIVSSPLSRARDTAAVIAEAHGLGEVLIEPLLLERSFGEAEGMSHEQWRAQYADGKNVPGGESLAELEIRSRQLIEKLASDFAGQRVLTVSHGALIRKILRVVSQGAVPVEGDRLGNASLSELTVTDQGWIVSKYDPRTLHSDLN